jgi:MFS family permease
MRGACSGMLQPAPHSLPESDPVIGRALRLNVAAGFLGSIWIAVANGMALPLFMEALQVSGFELGLLTAVRQLSTLAQIPAAYIGENLGRRKPAWGLLCGTHRFLWLGPALLPWFFAGNSEQWPVWILGCLGLSELLANCSVSLWFSWMADLVPAARAGRFWGGRQRYLSVAILLAALGFGGILQRSQGLVGFQIVFLVGAIFGVADIVLHLAVHEPVHRVQTHGGGLERLKAIWGMKRFRQLTWAMGVWTAAVTMPGYMSGLPSFFSVVYLKEALGASYGEASLVFAAAALGGVLWTPAIGGWIDRHGAARVLVWLMVLGPVVSLSWLCLGTGPGLWNVSVGVLVAGAASLWMGGAYAGVTLCQMRLTQECTEAGSRTLAMGVHLAVVGVMGAAGALVAGAIKDHVGVTGIRWGEGWAPFSYFQVLILVQVVLVWLGAIPLARGLQPDRN